MVVAIFVVLEIAVRLFFSRPGIVVRNEENNPQAMPYLLDQYENHKGLKVACIGSSVMQGYLNSWDDRAFPAMAEKILRKKYGYKNLKTFNFATAGNTFGDHLCVLNRVLKDDPDLIVHAVHFKLFSSFRPTPIARTDNAYYLLGHPELAAYLQRFNISTRDWVKIYLSGKVGDAWHTYGYRDLMSLLMFGTKKVPQKEIADAFHELFGFVSQEAMLARLNTPEEHNQEYLWKLLPQVLVAKHFEICGNFDFTDNNPSWVSFNDGAKLAALHDQSVMYYMTPINRPFVEEMNFFNWERVVPVMKERVYQVTRQYDHQILDYTQAVDPAYFSDTDHINMAGHKQVASRLAKDIDRRLTSRKHRAAKEK
ncbi:MAG: SGNH/GDSL hydrolase family protein [Deltaproteobacteria bacterium]|nr:SGNH/GDSL hydrolase family protein [Deltaproteobacteria bacterium]